MRRSRFVTRMAPVVIVAVVAVAAAAHAQTPAETGTQFYLKYRVAFDKAKSFDDILPFMSSKVRKETESQSAESQKKTFGLIKMLGAVTNLKVVKEEKTADGATLTVQGLGLESHKITGTIKLVRENGAWKLAEETWSF